MSFLPDTIIGLAYLFNQLGSCHDQLCGANLFLSLMVQWQKYLHQMQGAEVQIHGVKFNIFFIIPSLWEPRFKYGFHNSFWDHIPLEAKTSSSSWQNVMDDFQKNKFGNEEGRTVLQQIHEGSQHVKLSRLEREKEKMPRVQAWNTASRRWAREAGEAVWRADDFAQSTYKSAQREGAGGLDSKQEWLESEQE